MSTTELAALSRPASANLSQTTEVERARAIAEVQAAVFVAQQCPRDTGRVWAEMKDACGRAGLAKRAFWAVPNRGQGASVHLARELIRIWGNADHGVHELRRDDEAGLSEIRAYAWDQQANMRASRTFIVPHAKMANGGRKALTDLGDIYNNNQNQGARALRETIFSVLPRDFVDEAQKLCRQTLENGEGETVQQRADGAIRAFARFGVKLDQIEKRVGRKRLSWTPADLADLQILFGSIDRGETRAEEAFPTEWLSADEVAAQVAPRPATVPLTPAAAELASEPAVAAPQSAASVPAPNEPQGALLDPEPPAQPAPANAPRLPADGITVLQRSELNAAFKRLGVSKIDDKLTYATALLDGVVYTRMDELSRDDAELLMGQLRGFTDRTELDAEVDAR